MTDKQLLLMTPYVSDRATVTPFLHTDSEELFNSNKILRGPTWEWYNKPITYKLNKLGYRMDKEVEDVNFNDYFAFFGCSYAVGIGLNKEDTFAHKISNHYLKDYVNAAIGGSGVEFALYNFIQLLSNAPKPPKAVVVHWTEPARSLFWYKGVLHNFVVGYKGNQSDRYWKEVYNYWGKTADAIALEDSHVEHRFKLVQDTFRLICKQQNIPLFETTFTRYIGFKMDGVLEIDWQNKFARDIWVDNSNGHPGPYFHDEVLTKFNEFVKTNRLTLA